MYSLVDGGLMGGVMSNHKKLINLDLIETIQFFLKIYDLWRHPQPIGGCMGGWVDGWINGWGQVKSLEMG